MQSSGKSKRTVCSKLGLLIAAALVLSTIFSSIAMVMSVLTFYTYQAGVRVGAVPAENDTWMREATVELESIFEREGLMSFSKNHRNNGRPDDSLETAREQRNSVDREAEFDAMCNSTNTAGNHSDSTPLAHIVPLPSRDTVYDAPVTNDRFHSKSYVVTTKQWVCGRQAREYEFGVIAGGMVFNRSSGFLILPTDGVYYIYSHVSFVLKNSDTTYETEARMVACVPGVDCEVVDPHHLPPLLESADSIDRFHNRQANRGENGVYQGGLFHFPAHTQISLLIKDPKWGLSRREKGADDRLFTSLHTGNSYMGAILMQRMPSSTQQ